MSTFYLLPPRALLGQRLLAAIGLPAVQSAACAEVAEAIGKSLEMTGAFVVYRDDLPPNEEPARALADGFGAEVGDEVIELTMSDAPMRRWQISSFAA